MDMDLDAINTIMKMMMAQGPLVSFMVLMRYWDGKKEDKRRSDDAVRYDALVDRWIKSSEVRSNATVAVINAVKEKVDETSSH